MVFEMQIDWNSKILQKPLAPIGDGTSYRVDMMEKDIIDLLAEFLNFT